MSEIETETIPEVEAAPVPIAIEEEPIDIETALRRVLLKAQIHDGLARGLKEAVKALDRREAMLCCLSSNCSEPKYVELVTALCKEHTIPMIKVEDSKKLGEWVGLCKIDNEGKACHIVGCSCAVVKRWGEESKEREIVLNYVKSQGL